MMKIRFSPWRTFSRIILIQTFLILFLFLIMGFFSRLYFQNDLKQALAPTDFSHVLQIVLKTYDTGLLLFFLGVSTILGLFAVLLARKLVFPIGRILIKAQSVLHPQSSYSHSETPSDARLESVKLDEDPLQEWSDLESSIEEIRRDLETKIESLTLEREEQATLMSAISDGILAIDREESPLFYNSRFALLFENQELKQKRLWEIFEILKFSVLFKKLSNRGSLDPSKPFRLNKVLDEDFSLFPFHL